MTKNNDNTQVRKDWHPADIKAALAKKGYTFARLAREHGYVKNSPPNVLHNHWSQIERIVADIVGVQPAEIWPSRYDRFGRPLKERTARVTSKVRRLSEMKAASND